jgi:hypothetical protein
MSQSSKDKLQDSNLEALEQKLDEGFGLSRRRPAKNEPESSEKEAAGPAADAKVSDLEYQSNGGLSYTTHDENSSGWIGRLKSDFSNPDNALNIVLVFVGILMPFILVGAYRIASACGCGKKQKMGDEKSEQT